MKEAGRTLRRLLPAALVACTLLFVTDVLAEDEPASCEGAQASAAEEEVKILAGDEVKPVTDARHVPEVFEIGVSGELFFRIRADAAGFSAAERARIVETRIVHAISYSDICPESVHVRDVRGKPTIYIGNVRLVTVYPSDVAAAGAKSMNELARQWAESTACCLHRIAPWSRFEDRVE